MLENVIMLSIRLAVYIFIVNNVNSYLIYSIYWNVKYRFTLYKLNTRISCTYLETSSNTLDSFYPVCNDQDHYPNSAKSSRYTELSICCTGTVKIVRFLVRGFRLLGLLGILWRVRGTVQTFISRRRHEAIMHAWLFLQSYLTREVTPNSVFNCSRDIPCTH